MKISTKHVLPVMVLLLASCNKDEAFSPVANGSSVSLSIQLPKHLEMLPLRVMYRSDICRKKQVDGSGNSYKEAGYKTMNLVLKNEGKGNEYKIPIPRNGGGDCEWKLSNLTLRFQSIPGDGDAQNVPASEVVIFDNNAPQQLRGSYIDINGDLDLTGDYFPMVTTYYINGDKKVSSIVKGESDKMYRMHSGNSIYFNPTFHSRKIIKAVEPKEQKIGVYMSVTYPDGTVESSPYFPNYKKLQLFSKSSN